MRRTSKTSDASPRPTFQQGFSLPLWSLGLIALVFAVVAVFAGVILFRVVEEFVATSPFAVATVPPPEGTSSTVAEATPAPDEEEVIEVGLEGEQSPGQLPVGITPQDRVTVLVLGIDQPCEFIEEPYRSDTMVLVTVDPWGKTAALLSIPRDLWVPIPGFGNNRINTAYRSGEVSQYPGGGPALAVRTVEYNLGVHVHYYVTVNFDGFVEAVDLIGGIEIDVPQTINDPDYPDRCYGYDPFYIEAGHQTLNGEKALKYARTRATFGADFDRADRQQEVMMAAWDKVTEQNLALLARAPEFWNAYTKNVTTNMTYQEAVGLVRLALEVPRENIHRAVIDYNYVRDYTAPDGARVLVPIREKIREMIGAYFSSTAPPAPELDTVAQMRAENAQILVLNGTWTPGMARATADYLEPLGFTVIGVDDAEDKNQTATRIIDYGGKTSTVDYLAEIMGVPAGSIYGGSEPDGDYDVKLILGSDWQVPTE